jgi:septal ring factor EnvC (AmiA/AmiB activator)
MGHAEAAQSREPSLLAEANMRARAEEESQLEGLRGVIDEVTKRQRQEGEKVSQLGKAMGDVRLEIDGVALKLSETQEPLDKAMRGRIVCLGLNQMLLVCGQRWQAAARTLRMSGE